jgi:protein required for attachment to host cells
MVKRLHSEHLKGGFDKLVLMAAPAVLGDLRKSLTADLTKIVITEIPKDVIGQGDDKIRSQLKRALALS